MIHEVPRKELLNLETFQEMVSVQKDRNVAPKPAHGEQMHWWGYSLRSSQSLFIFPLELSKRESNFIYIALVISLLVIVQ